MPKFTGPKNIVLFSEADGRSPFDCTYDVESGLFVADISTEQADLYGQALIAEGMTEASDIKAPVAPAEEPPAPAAPAPAGPTAEELAAEAEAHDAAVAQAVAAAEAANAVQVQGDNAGTPSEPVPGA